jgi:hypothetical protein
MLTCENECSIGFWNLNLKLRANFEDRDLNFKPVEFNLGVSQVFRS